MGGPDPLPALLLLATLSCNGNMCIFYMAPMQHQIHSEIDFLCTLSAVQ